MRRRSWVGDDEEEGEKVEKEWGKEQKEKRKLKVDPPG